MDQVRATGALGQATHVDRQLQSFWAERAREIERTRDLRTHGLPLARIKKIMKADEEVRMISAEAPVVFSKACEIFILELTLRAWINTEENKRRTLQKNDIAAAVARTDVFDFLVDIVPREELMGEDGAGLPGLGGPGEGGPYFYLGGAPQAFVPWPPGMRLPPQQHSMPGDG